MASVSSLWQKKILAVLYGRGTVTRSEVVERTGLNVGSVSRTLKKLIANGVVRTVGKLKSTGGRRSHALQINPEAAYFLVFDLEGIRNQIGFVNLAGDVRYRWDDLCGSRPPTPLQVAGTAREVLKRLRQSERQRTVAIGVSYTGLLDHTGGLSAANLGWTGVHLGKELQRSSHLPVYMEPESITKALVEHSLGGARGVKNWIHVTADEGIGGGFYVDGHLLRGRDAMAGEIGHLTVATGPRCKCGRMGCLEAIAAPPAIIRQYAESSGNSAAALSISTVIARARAGDVNARSALDLAAHYLGLALSHLVNLLNPSLIILGGSLAAAEDLLLPTLRKEMACHTLPPLLQGVQITTTSLGEDVALKGAASLAFRRSIEDPQILTKICNPVFVLQTKPPSATRKEAVLATLG